MSEPPRETVPARAEQERRRRQRNIALALVLLALVVLFYVLTFVKGPGVATQGF
jgi:hypothetical protein